MGGAVSLCAPASLSLPLMSVGTGRINPTQPRQKPRQCAHPHSSLQFMLTRALPMTACITKVLRYSRGKSGLLKPYGITVAATCVLLSYIGTLEDVDNAIFQSGACVCVCLCLHVCLCLSACARVRVRARVCVRVCVCARACASACMARSLVHALPAGSYTTCNVLCYNDAIYYKYD